MNLDDAVNELSAAIAEDETVQPSGYTPKPGNAVDAAVFQAFGIEADETVQEAPEAATEGKPSGTKAQRRIKQLLDRSKKAETELQEMRTSLGQSEVNLKNQFSQQLQQLQHQNQLLQQQMQHQFSQVNQGRQEEYEAASPPKSLEEYEQRHLRKVKKEMEGLLEARVQNALKPYQEELGKMRQEQAYKDEMLRKQQTHSYYTGKAAKVYNELLAKDLGAEDAADLAEPLKELVLTASAAFNQEPEAVAPILKKMFDKYYAGRLKTHQLRAKAQNEKNKAKPAVMTSARNAAAVDDLPDHSSAAVKKAGYRNYMDAFANGFRGVK